MLVSDCGAFRIDGIERFGFSSCFPAPRSSAKASFEIRVPTMRRVGVKGSDGIVVEPDIGRLDTEE